MARFANLLIGLMATAVALILAYLLYRQLSGTPASPTLYAAVIGVFLLLLAAFKLPVSARLNLSILLVTVIASLYAVELFLLLFGNPLEYRTPRFMAARTLGVPFDVRTPLQVTAALRKEGLNAYPYLAPFTFRSNMPTVDGAPLYALSSIANVTTVLCNEGGSYAQYESDSHGFQNPTAAEADPWQRQKLEIVALGDSFTLGNCVAPEANAVGLLRKRYPQTLNLGANGNGPLSVLAGLQEYAARFQPRVVLWFYFEGNDLGDLLQERDNPVLIRYLYEENFSQNLVDRQLVIDQTRRDHIAIIERDNRVGGADWLASLRLYQVRRLLKLTRDPAGESQTFPEGRWFARVASAATLQGDPLVTEGIPLLTEVAQALQRRVQGWGGELIVVYLPAYGRYAESPIAADALYRQATLEVFRSLKLSVVDLHPLFAAQPDPLSLFALRMDGHYSEAGYTLVAEAVLGELTSR